MTPSKPSFLPQSSNSVKSSYVHGGELVIHRPYTYITTVNKHCLKMLYPLHTKRVRFFQVDDAR